MPVISYYLVHILHRRIEYIVNTKAVFTIRVRHGECFGFIGCGGRAALNHQEQATYPDYR